MALSLELATLRTREGAEITDAGAGSFIVDEVIPVEAGAGLEEGTFLAIRTGPERIEDPAPLRALPLDAFDALVLELLPTFPLRTRRGPLTDDELLMSLAETESTLDPSSSSFPSFAVRENGADNTTDEEDAVDIVVVLVAANVEGIGCCRDST